MPRIAASLIAASLACAAPWTAAQLQPPRGMPGPTAAPATDPWQALAFFEGNWTIAPLPAGTRFDESCTWLSALRRHLVCRSRTEAAGVVQEGLGVFSYRAADGMYVYRSFDPNGEVDVLKGRLTGELWQFSGVSGTGPNERRTRLTISPGGERSFRLAEEVATGTGAFQSQPDLVYVPSVPPTSAR